MLSSPVQSVLYAVMTKSVGSGYRIHDDWEAPVAVRQKTIEREAILLGLTTAFTSGIQMVFSRVVHPVLQQSPALRKYELLLRALATAPALVLAEGVSRQMAPKTGWVKPDDDDDDAEDRFERQQGVAAARPAAPTQPLAVARPVVPAAMPVQRFSAMAGPFQAMQQNRVSTATPFRYDRRDDDDD